MEAAIVLQKCEKNKKIAGIRVEKMGQNWCRTWAFAIDEARAGREGFTQTKLTGNFGSISENYPGCPYCGAKGFCQCGACGRLGCYNGDEIYSCPWCGNTGAVGAADSIDLDSGVD